jgi:hypothetical protein
VAVAALALAATNASAAAGNGNQVHGNQAAHAGSVTPASTVTSAATKSATSLGLIGLEDTRTEVLQGLSGGSPKKLGLLVSRFVDDIAGTAIDTSGKNTVLATDTSSSAPVLTPGTHPRFGPLLNLNQFNGEGDSGYHFFSEGVAVRGNAALVTGDERGVAQLIFTSGSWRVDARVHFPGTTDAGFARARGFIPFRTSADDENEFDGVVISPTALPNGKYLGVVVDRDDKRLAVVEGVGTAKPKVVGSLVDPALAEGSGFTPDEGNGGVAFSPATPTRAVLTTPTGFAVLNLSRPSHPNLQSLTTVGTADDAESITVAADGNHVVEAVADTAYVYSGLLKATAGSPLSPLAMIPAGDTLGEISDVAYLANGTLALVHGDSPTDFKLTMYRQATTATPTIANSAALPAQPESSNTLSVWPSSVTPSVHPRRLLHGARVGKHVKQKLSVAGGIGSYTFKVTRGKLPKGLKRHGATISGTPKVAGKFRFTITAISQFGEGVVKKYKVTIRPRK